MEPAKATSTIFRGFSATKVLCFLVVLGNLLWFSLKLKLFGGFEYTMDILIHTQKSRSFLQGYPLLYDSFLGPHPYHNSFIEIFFAPFTFYFGSLGLLVPYAIIFGLSSLLVVTVLPTGTRQQRAGAFFFVSVVLLSPVSFWLYDDPFHGWHPDLLAFPLSLFFTYGLIRCHPSPRALLYSPPLILTHEGGAIAAWGIHILSIMMGGQDDMRVSARCRFIRCARVTAAWLGIFIIGLLVQRLWDDTGKNRLSNCLVGLVNGELVGFWELGLAALDVLIVLQSACLMGFLITARMRDFALTVLCCIPIISAMTLAGLSYTSDIRAEWHNALWVPRFSFILGVASSGLVFSLKKSRSKSDNPAFWYLYSAVVGIFALLMQHSQLVRARSYDVFNRVVSVAQNQLFSARFSSSELLLLECLNQSIPLDMPMSASSGLWTVFHNHNLDPGDSHNSWSSIPQIRVCDVGNRTPLEPSCSRGEFDSSHGITSLIVIHDAIEVQYLEQYHAIVDGCISNLEQEVTKS
jgi:hypothetical protein